MFNSKFRKAAGLLLFGGVIAACNQSTKDKQEADANVVRLITVDPGHFHAALVQKSMYPEVDSVVQVYAPADGKDLQAHLGLINDYNNRETDPTHWKEEIYTGPDFLDKMLKDRKGNVVVLAGNNKRKIDYISSAIEGGFNVLADKPMVIDKKGFSRLEKAFATANEKGVLLYDIMTERFEITATLQRALSRDTSLFGKLEKGSLQEPAITKESVHHFFKSVSGKPLIRPTWFFDVSQQGEGIVDVTTHLVDLVQWEGFPEQRIDYKKDIEVLNARRWATWVKKDEFKKATNEDIPDSLKEQVNPAGDLGVYANGEINYKIKGVFAKVMVKWNFEAPEGAGDTHYSIMRGTKANLIIKQGPEEGYKPVLYIELPKGNQNANFDQSVQDAVKKLSGTYQNLQVEKMKTGFYRLVIPEVYKTSHEEHFGQVTKNFLSYLEQNKLPDWEVPNMLAKYYITTEALSLAKKNKK